MKPVPRSPASVRLKESPAKELSHYLRQPVEIEDLEREQVIFEDEELTKFLRA